MMDYLKTIVCYIIALFAHKKYQDCWIIGERGTDARDNGYWLYKYIKENHPDRKIYYLIDPKSADYSKIRKLGESIKPDTVLHGVVFLSCDTVICTHTYLCRPSWKGMHFAFTHKIFNKNERRVFLDHGIVKDYLPAFTYPTLDVDLFTCGAKPEYDYIVQKFNFPIGVVQYTGLARFDNLFRHIQKERETNKVILYMPTWRFYLSKCHTLDEFVQSEFYTKMNSFLSDTDVREMLEAYDYRLIFYPHYEVQKWIKAFKDYSPRITVADFNHYDVQKLLIDCDMLITDYSSVFFDVAYMNKPVIFYQFDQQLFRRTQYQEGYFDYDNSFGPVVETHESLVNEVEKYLRGDFDVVYHRKQKEFFPINDDKCCERIYSLTIGCKRK